MAGHTAITFAQICPQWLALQWTVSIRIWEMGVVGSPSLHFGGKRSELLGQRITALCHSNLVRTDQVSDFIFGAIKVDRSSACYVGAGSCFWKKLGIMLPTSFRMWYTEQDSDVSEQDFVKCKKCCGCLHRMLRNENL